MKTEDLDLAYTEFCNTLTRLGEEHAQLFLARFALLAIVSTGDLHKVRKLIVDAAALDAPDSPPREP